MVLERSDAGLVYAPPSLDLTNELIRKYNARFGAGSRPRRSRRAAEARQAGRAARSEGRP